MKKIVMALVLLTVVLVGYKILQPNHSMSDSTTAIATDNIADDSTNSALTSIDFNDIPPTYVDSDPKAVVSISPTLNSEVNLQPVAASFSCDSRKHCSQMTSCAEATYFIQHCPNTKMDGNNDGIPCEKQWCQ